MIAEKTLATVEYKRCDCECRQEKALANWRIRSAGDLRWKRRRPTGERDWEIIGEKRLHPTGKGVSRVIGRTKTLEYWEIGSEGAGRYNCYVDEVIGTEITLYCWGIVSEGAGWQKESTSEIRWGGNQIEKHFAVSRNKIGIHKRKLWVWIKFTLTALDKKA